MGLADTAKLAVDLSLGGNFVTNLGKAQRQLSAFDSQVSRSASRSYQAGQQIGNGIKNLAKITVGVIGTGAGLIGASLKLAGDFEAQLNTINTIAHKTPADLKAVGDQLRGIAKKTGQSLDDLTQSYYDLLSAGVKTADAQAVLNDAVTLGIGGLSTTAEAVDLLTTAYNAYGLNAAGAAKATDQFAQAVADGKVTASEIAGTFADIAPLAKSAGVGIDQIAASYGYLTAQGEKAGQVATNMRQALAAILSPSKALAKAGKELGVNWEQEVRKKGLVPALNEIRAYATKTHTPLQDLFGRLQAVQFVLETTGPAFAGYEAELAKMGKASGTAAAQMAEREKGLNFQLGKLKALAKDAGITIGSALLPKITPLVEKLNELIQGHQQDIAKFGDQLAGLFTKDNIDKGIAALTDLFNTAKDVAPAIAGAAQITGKAVQVAVDAFKSLPPDLQKLAIGLLAVNKLTGGLVTNALGGIVGAILGQLKGAIVNVSGAVVNVNGAGSIPGTGGAPAAAARGLGAVTAVLALGSVAALEIGIAGAIGDWLKANVPGWGTPEGAFNIGPVKIGGQSESQRLHQPPATLQTSVVLDKGDREAFNSIALAVQNSARGEAFIAQNLRASGRELYAAIKDLAKQADPKKIAADLANINQTLVNAGKGNLKTAQDAAASIRRALKGVHDPQTQAALRAALKAVEGKIPGREYAQRQLAKADKIIHGTGTLSDKIRALQAIENDLKNHKLPGQTAALKAKLDALKASQAAEQRKTAQAVRDKDMSFSVTIPISERVVVNSRSVFAQQRTYTHYLNTSSAGPGK